MLDRYLEKNIQNKLELFNILHSRTSVTMNELLSFLPLSIESVHTLVNELNMDLAGLAEIKRQSPYFIIEFYEEVTFMELLHAVYQSSNILHCLKFMILNEKNHSLTEFIEMQYLTKSSAYRIRERCKEYLQAVGLNLTGNRVVGEEYRIRFLIALLHYKYGIDCYPLEDSDIQLTREFTLSTNSVIDENYPEVTSNEYGFFEYLFVLLWKRKNFATEPICSEQLDACKKIFVYEKLKKALKDFEPRLKIHLTEYDYDYIYLVYCTTNSSLFADQWTKQDVDLVHDIVFSDPVFQDLLQRIEEKLGKEIANSHVLRSSLVYFYKKCLLELQCIIPNKNFYLDSKKSHLTQTVFEAVSNSLEDWQNKQHRTYEIDKGHVFYLTLQLELIIKQFLKPVPIFVLSELSPDLEITTLYLRRLFPVQRVTVRPFFIGAENKDFLCSQKRSVIVVNRKFQHLIESWNLSEQNTVIPVTVELNAQELIRIQKAIMYYETGNFFDFINQM